MKMTYIITIEADAQPGLIDALDRCKSQIRTGLSHINMVVPGQYGIIMSPKDKETAEEMNRQYEAAHPTKKPNWVD